MKALDKARWLIVAAAGLSFALSVFLWFSGQKEEGLFVGIWVPSILSLGSLIFASRNVASK
jgi:hypothetical protein